MLPASYELLHTSDMLAIHKLYAIRPPATSQACSNSFLLSMRSLSFSLSLSLSLYLFVYIYISIYLSIYIYIRVDDVIAMCEPAGLLFHYLA